MAALLAGLALGVLIGALAGYALACRRHTRRLDRTADHAAALRAQLDAALADLTAIPPSAVVERQRAADWRRRQVERMDAFYLSMRTPSPAVTDLGVSK